jgi:murein DD-endopeptidase MepM/ murein hydrolase activator NlpD
MGMSNPANGQGVFQLYSSGAFFKPGPVTKEEFTRQAVLAANLMKEKAKGGAVPGELSLSNPDKVKDTLFSYNGRAAQYGQQAKALGYNLPAEGSPYVMNLADDARNSNKNPNWGQILTDNGPLGKANQAPGAWVLIEGLTRIEQKAHDQAVAKQQAEAQEFEAKKAAERKAAEDAEKAKNKLGVFDGWHNPIPGNAAVTSKFGPRGQGVLHTGEDFGVKTGTPFLAAAGGVVKVFEYDVSNAAFCKAALAGLGVSMDAIKDPIQKEVQVTSVVDGVTYVTVYAHMSKIDVKDGELVAGGQKLGETGGSGCSTGDHAHFEIRKNGTTPIDPATVLGGAIKSSSSEIKVIDDGHDHNHEGTSTGALTNETAAPIGEGASQPADEGLLKIDHSNEVSEGSEQTKKDPAVEQVVSEAIEKARLAAAISSAALDRARSNDRQLVK